ncbi:hypothetical protein J1614_009610 [Plenodomus biglobosus]|nr:hypothetical protein J1614_009610 [Plenodomus biglobosus]
MHLNEAGGKRQVTTHQPTRGDLEAPKINNTTIPSHVDRPVFGHQHAAYASSHHSLESHPCVNSWMHEGLEKMRLGSQLRDAPASQSVSRPGSFVTVKDSKIDGGCVTARGADTSDGSNSSQITESETRGKLADRPLLKPRMRSQEILQNFLAPFQGSEHKPNKNDGVSRQRWSQRIRLKNHSGSLSERLKAAYDISHMCERRFIPVSRLRKLVTHLSIAEALHPGMHDPLKIYQLRKKVKSICLELQDPQKGISRLRTRSTSSILRDPTEKAYRKVFAILALVNRSADIFDFVEGGFCDANLPICCTPSLKGDDHYYSINSKTATESPACFQEWSLSAKRDFEVKQWSVISPCFTDGLDKAEHLPLNRQAILPFVTWEKAAEQPGACGQVYKAKIHQDHHDFDERDVPDNIVAVKKLISQHPDRDRNKIAFEHEANILRSISRRNHLSKHLIRLLASFEFFDQYYLIFPWADYDLEGYWEHVPPKPDLANWVVIQCKGLAEALSTIHHYDTSTRTIMPHVPLIPPERGGLDRTDSAHISLVGRHGDIKPNNILWFRREGQYGMLKITDFGLADFTTENRARRKENGFVPNTLTYRSPECDLPDGEISPQCDVWALGCVYLIFICWYLGGWRDVIQFRERRIMADEYWWGLKTDSFFTIVRKEGKAPKAKVKPVVSQRINRFRSNQSCPLALRSLLNTIETKMLQAYEKS